MVHALVAVFEEKVSLREWVEEYIRTARDTDLEKAMDLWDGLWIGLSDLVPQETKVMMRVFQDRGYADSVRPGQVEDLWRS